MDIVPVYVGLDYHDEMVRVCVIDSDGQVLASKYVPNDPAAVVDFVRSRSGLVRCVAIEACCGAADFAMRLEKLTEWKVQLAHAGAVQRMKKNNDKTDHGDAWHLADLVRVNYLPKVWLADEQTRQLRRLVRHRDGLAADRKNIKLRIRSLLREERLVDPERRRAWTKGWLEWLKTAPLGEHARWVCDRELVRLERLETDIQEVEDRMTEATREDETTQKLLEEPGIGLVTAVTMRAVIGRFDRFRTGKQLSRYCGLSPQNASTANKEVDAGLLEGHAALRAVLIQLAKRLPRIDDHWRELSARLRQRKPANVASATVANRWVRRLYHKMVCRPDQESGRTAA